MPSPNDEWREVRKAWAGPGSPLEAQRRQEELAEKLRVLAAAKEDQLVSAMYDRQRKFADLEASGETRLGMEEIERDALEEQEALHAKLAPVVDRIEVDQRHRPRHRTPRKLLVHSCERVDVVRSPINGAVQIMRYYPNGNHDVYVISQEEIHDLGPSISTRVFELLQNPHTNDELELFM